MQSTTGPLRPERLAQILSKPFLRFLEIETGSAILLLSMTVVALIWANLPHLGETYHHFWSTELGLELGPWAISLSLEEWVNDALMGIFFFAVGMEIKRELVSGELATPHRAMLPVFGALGGMVGPALIYTAFHYGGPAIHGWGIPMATDIAFAVAALSVLGRRVPPGLKIFLLALAIADDLGAVAVIAVFYTAELSFTALGVAAALFAFTYALNRAGVRALSIYFVVGAGAWLAMHESGVHATVAGVVLGFLTPTATDVHTERVTDRVFHAVERLRELAQGRHEDPHGERRHEAVRELGWSRELLSPLDFLTHQLDPWVFYVIMPIFALANAGVVFDPRTLGSPEAFGVGTAVALGLLLGKPIGIALFSYVAVKVRIAELPDGVSWAAILATGLLAGIGFTVALFITALAFENPTFTDGAKVGILAASATAAISGVLLLSFTLPRPTANPQE